MPNRIALLTAAAALAVSPALAQQTTPAPSQPAPQAQPAPQTQPGMSKSFVESQSSDQWSASKLIGLRVMGPGDENIGSISDLIVDKEGNIVAAVIGVGGFLGIGRKDVAVNFDSLNVTRNDDGEEEASVKTSKADLESAPAFKPYEAPRPAAQSSPGSPGGGGSKPGGL